MESARRGVPAEAGQRARSRDLRHLRHLARFVAPYRLQIGLAFLALVTAALAVLVVGIGLRHLIDGGFVTGRPEALDHALKAMLIVVAVLAGATYARFYLVTWLGERVVADLRSAVYRHVLRLSPGFFEVTKTGEVLSRLTADTSVIQSVIGSSLSQALRNLLLLAGGLVMLVLTNAKLTGLVVLAVPFVVLPIVIFGRRVRTLSRGAQDAVAAIGGQAEESLNAIRTVQAFAQEEREQDRFDERVGTGFAAAIRQVRARAQLTGLVILIVFGAIVGVLWVGGHDVLAGRITPGELAAFVFYAVTVASATGALSEIAGDLQRAAGASERLFELLATEPAITAPAGALQARERAQGRVTFEAVDFAYPARPDHPVLHGFSLDVDPGSTVALVGPSGAGKTSVLQLLMRFYDPQNGRILLDGRPLDREDPRTLRRHFGLVPQDPVIFSADAWSNIRYGRPGASDDEVRAAAVAARADEFLDRLPDGFGTFLGEKGVRLSGGQRQRLAIARALLCDPAVLLLDEATSALDAENERLVQEALDRLMDGRTSLVIAHRLATVRRADRIVVMEAGQTVAAGRHDDLVAEGGLYARLAELQFDLPEDERDAA
ncbi:ABC transporter transmembrane domain-containing protein [Marinivivus vitaminiproducens]|uniref:ABC transporter transmembrane domain-containing protein n=1 Tax=Marinivivus vitaminiproducens TaxID=3035935 RepID=UPI00279C5FCB|nr:ABC transporter transmembrane domain-containing protein [Geminicoccaceae bacterium SCSIO 64248]